MDANNFEKALRTAIPSNEDAVKTKLPSLTSSEEAAFIESQSAFFRNITRKVTPHALFAGVDVNR